MIFRDNFFQKLVGQKETLLSLFRYLVLQTETHAFCLGLACAALIGFYPFCFLLLSVAENVFKWERPAEVVIALLYEYYPRPDFLVSNLKASLGQSGRTMDLSSVLWVLLGAAGVFIPLESGLNRLWKVEVDRPYWRNQLVGLTLTVACALLAFGFVTITASVQAVIHFVLR